MASVIKFDKVRQACENKLDVTFRDGKELNGWYMIDGVKVCRVTVSKGNKDVPPKTLKRIAESLYLTTEELVVFAQCKLKESDIRGFVTQRKPTN